MHLNGDIASGRPGTTSYQADFRLERIDLQLAMVAIVLLLYSIHVSRTEPAAREELIQ